MPFAWVYVEKAGLSVDKQKQGSFYIRDRHGLSCQDRGWELGHADDAILPHTEIHSMTGRGSVGILTHGVLDRTAILPSMQ